MTCPRTDAHTLGDCPDYTPQPCRDTPGCPLRKYHDGPCAPCPHPSITAQLIAERDALARADWSSHWYYVTCPACGWRGYPYVTTDGDIVCAEEPRGAGA